LKRIDGSLAKLRQQKTLLNYMDENQDKSKYHGKEKKILRKMRFQFEQEEKQLETEKKQLQWKVDGTLIVSGKTKITIPNFEVVESLESSEKNSK
jgi:hypothetical protein